jgi:hypothetical protein
MHAIRKLGMLTALRALQTAEYLLEGLIRTRSFLPYAAISLLGGFALGYLFIRF